MRGFSFSSSRKFHSRESADLSPRQPVRPQTEWLARRTVPDIFRFSCTMLIIHT